LFYFITAYFRLKLVGATVLQMKGTIANVMIWYDIWWMGIVSM